MIKYWYVGITTYIVVSFIHGWGDPFGVGVLVFFVAVCWLLYFCTK